MSKRSWWLLAFASTMVAVLSWPAPVAWGGDDEEDDDPFVPNQLIVELEDFGDPNALVADYDEIIGIVASIDATDVHLVQLSLPPGVTEEAFADLLEQDPRVDDAELNHATEAPEGSTQDFYVFVGEGEFDDQYTFAQINLDAAHASSTGAGVIVALLDTGLDVNHPALAGVTVLPGYNVIDANEDVSEPLEGTYAGHGTFMAGLIATMAPDAALLPVRVLDGEARGNAFQVAEGIYYAIAQGADVINLSLATPDANTILEMAAEDADSEDVAIVAAVGNLDSQVEMFPAAHDGVVAVASTDVADHKSEFSSFGEHVSLCGPGTDVVSIVPDGQYARWNGTSISTAIVSGAAALVLSLHPLIEPDDVGDVLCLAAVDIDQDNPGYAGQLGCGRLDVAAAMDVQPDVGADLDEDGTVGVSDLAILIQQWGAIDSPADLDDDGVVGVADLVILITYWG